MLLTALADLPTRPANRDKLRIPLVLAAAGGITFHREFGQAGFLVYQDQQGTERWKTGTDYGTGPFNDCPCQWVRERPYT